MIYKVSYLDTRFGTFTTSFIPSDKTPYEIRKYFLEQDIAEEVCSIVAQEKERRGKSMSLVYQLSPDLTEERLVKLGFYKGSFRHRDSSDFWYSKAWDLYEGIEFIIHINMTTREWNDYNDIDVLDVESGRPYETFYEYLEGSMTMYPFLNNVIDTYEERMNQLVAGGVLVLIQEHDNKA